MKYIFLIWLAATTFVSAADFFPLQPGNHWILRSANGAKQEVRVGLNLLSKDNQTYHSLTGYRAERSWLRLDENGELQWLNMETELPELLTRFDPERGTYTTQLAACKQQAAVHRKRVEWKNLPALKIEYTGGCPDNTINEELYLENIGLVQRVVSTIAGPVTYELTEARVGNLIYANQTGSLFDISVSKPTLDGPVKVTLRLSSRHSEPIRLLFSTGQQYEFKLIDRAGEVVWKWSDGRVFIAGLSEETVIDRSWEQNILVEDVPAGVYTLEGSLTNSGPYRFASSMTVRIP